MEPYGEHGRASATQQTPAYHGIDGLELTRRLKADPLTKDIRVIVLTACAMPGEREIALAVVCDDYLTKSIDTRNLPGLIARCLELPKEAQP